MSKEHEYSNGEVTIVWKSALCIHSKRCWKELGAVFKPGERPWIKADGASTERIVEQVGRCPSGALSIRRKEDAPPTDPGPTGIVVHVSPDGPRLLKGACTVLHARGCTEVHAHGTAFCRRGGSGNKPYSDGSHRRYGFLGRVSPADPFVVRMARDTMDPSHRRRMG